MSQLQVLKAASSRADVATLLGFKNSTLVYILHKMPEERKYQVFDISKRGGGTRTICAPFPELMNLQRRVANVLQDCIDEINAANKRKDQMAHGFKRRKSIITNATKHRGKRYVFNIDLQDFFGTINFGRVRGLFLKDRNFALQPTPATVLAQIACYQNSLPQGSPCSPVISNLVGHVLDVHLSQLASKAGCTYSRYADDITFSTNKRIFPSSIAVQVEAEPHKWKVGNELERSMRRGGFTINQQKVRMQYEGSRQSVTGLVVNQKVNIKSEYRRAVRAMAHRLFMTGKFEITQGANTAVGTLAQLHGMLGHIDRVDWYNAKLNPPDDQQLKDSVGLGSKEVLYRRFLLYKEIYVAGAPTIICEGKTDNIYLKHAIRSLATRFPQLADTTGNSATLKVRIFKYPNTSTGRILKLRGGTGDLKNFIALYRNELGRFKAPGMQFPVILLIDNDDGSKSILKVVENIIKVKPTPVDDFTHVVGNLYLVLTPPKAGGQSVIEDSFTQKTINVVLNNKHFDPSDDFDPATHFGKAVFSQYVDKNSGAVDFSGFTEILTRLTAVITAHARQVAGAVAPRTP